MILPIQTLLKNLSFANDISVMRNLTPLTLRKWLKILTKSKANDTNITNFVHPDLDVAKIIINVVHHTLGRPCGVERIDIDAGERIGGKVWAVC